MSEGGSKAREIDLGENFGDVIVKANGAQITISADGNFHGLPIPANDTVAKATHQIGAIENTGEHKGEIYGGIYPADNKPIWFSAAPRLMDHYTAAAWAEGQDGSLPTREQGDYLTTLKRKGGAFAEIFNRGRLFPDGYVWLAEPFTINGDHAWCQEVCSGDQDHYDRINKLPVLSARR